MQLLILSDERFAKAQSFYALACAASRMHSTIAEIALNNHGDHGSLISGCVRDHFPEATKDALRELAKLTTIYCDKALAAKPARVHASTMRHLARCVATRDGTGFYGPQPYRKGI